MLSKIYVSLFVLIILCNLLKTSLSQGNTCNRGGPTITRLTNEDFESGTYRITESGIYVLREDIIFSPNANRESPNDPCSYMPCNDPNYPGSFDDDIEGPYKLGFFAAISIEANDVELNLCGYSISMSFEFYIQQRYYAHIEISSSPFIVGQGPFDIGDSFENVTDVIIRNGELGLSSHHGMHGLSPNNILIEDLVIRDFEVAAIHLNGFRNAEIRNIDIGPGSTQAAVTAFWSAARFLIKPFTQLLLRDPTSEIDFSDREESVSIADMYDDLIEQMDLVFKYIIGDLTIEELQESPDSYLALREGLILFRNSHNFPDCSAQYGMVLHSAGVAVEGFGDGIGFSSNAVLENINIHDLQLQIREVPGYIQSDVGAQAKGPFGDVVDMLSVLFNAPNEDLTEILSTLEYNGNPLSDGQIAISMFGQGATERGKTANIGDEFLDWVQGEGTLEGELTCNQDIMAHLNKGIIGIRIEEVNTVSASNIDISYLNNWSDLGSLVCGNYTGPDDGGHEAQQKWEGYQGADSRGISIYGSSDVELINVNVSHVNSFKGHSTGIDILDQDSSVALDGDIIIDYIRAGIGCNLRDLEMFEMSMAPNETPIGCAFECDTNSTIIGKEIVESSNIEGFIIC